MGNRPTHFEIPVDDPDRAEKFYSAVFGWNIQAFPGAPTYYGLAGTGDAQPGIDGALMQRGEGSSETRITMSVESIEDASERVLAQGGKILQGKMPIPGMGYFATCEDTEGNPIGIFTEDPTASM
jgi:uncharacterized protein